MEFSDADVAVRDALKGQANAELATEFPHVYRWLTHCESLGDCAASSSGAPSSSSGPANGSQTIQLDDKYKNYNVDLKGATYGNVVTRFPPEPSGYMHIGHVKAAVLNEVMARKYGGKMILRFDDTNPERESDEFETTIREDVKKLGIEPDMITWTSNHFPMLLEKGWQLINEGKAYCDKTDGDQMSKDRMDGVESPYRSNSLEENQRLFQAMIDAKDPEKDEGFACCVRAKIDMQNDNKCLRDPMMWRCKDMVHHRLGDKWPYKLFPGYDFACPIVDSVEGVTHAMRTLEYKDREAQYQWVCNALGIRCPEIYEFSRLNFTNTCLSKRKLTQMVNKKITTGWDDPRMPTVRGILRKGMTVQGLREYIYQQGASRNESLQEWYKIWALNKQLIDPVVPRYTAILSSKVCVVKCEGGKGIPQGVETKMRLLHPKDTKDGLTLDRVKALDAEGLPHDGLGYAVVRFFKEFYLEIFDANSFAEGEEITLMGWGNAIVKRMVKDADGDVVEMGVELNLEGDFKKTKKKVTWLAALNDLVPVTLVDLKHLINVPKLMEGMDALDHVTPDSWVETSAFGDQNLRLLKKGELIQLNRKGYYKCDRPFVSAQSPMVLISVPDGKVAKAKKTTGAKS